jgi:hypothetical protein
MGALDQPLFVESWALYGSGGEKVDALSTPLINSGAGSEPSLRLSCGINSDMSNHPSCAFDPQRVPNKNRLSLSLILRTHPPPVVCDGWGWQPW